MVSIFEGSRDLRDLQMRLTSQIRNWNQTATTPGIYNNLFYILKNIFKKSIINLHFLGEKMFRVLDKERKKVASKITRKYFRKMRLFSCLLVRYKRDTGPGTWQTWHMTHVMTSIIWSETIRPEDEGEDLKD